MRAKNLLSFLLLLCFVLARPALAQISEPPCTPPLQKPNGPPPPVSLLVATHQCLLSNYTHDNPNVDYVQVTQDLEQAGIGRLVAGPDGLSEPKRVSILNDYAFWKLQQHNGWSTHQAVDVLHIVVKLAPDRTVAWLNLGDALRSEMDSVAFPNGVFFAGTLSPTPEQQITLAHQAVAAYRRYVALSSKPVGRVSAYLEALPTLQPKEAANWSTLDAIIHTADAPKAAAVVLGLDDQPAAKLALAMDLALFQPSPNQDQINDLLDAAVASSWDGITPPASDGFDGTASSFIPYLQAVEPPNGEGNFPVACGLLRKYPELIQATEADWGSSRDNFDPVIACNDPKLQLPVSVTRLENDLGGPSGAGNMCGTIHYGVERAYLFNLQVLQYEPQALLPPFTSGSDGNPGPPSVGQQEANDMRRLNIGPDSLPLQDWGETDISSYNTARQTDVDFKQAKHDLLAYYHTVFGLSQNEAAQAAFHAVWLVDGATGWAVSGKLDPLAEALLGHQPLTQVQAALVQDSPVPAALLFDAVAYPDALKLLLAEHPDITVVTPIGKTVLMEAAKYNDLDSVKLLLAAGANVNASSLAPADIKGNAQGEMCTDGGYIITHGQRTALMYAAANAGLPVIKVLLAAGADKHAKDSTGATALDYLDGHGPVAKNPVLNAADFKTAQFLLTP